MYELFELGLVLTESPIVVFTEPQLAWVQEVAELRRLEAQARGARDAHGASPGEITPAVEVRGVAAELAVSLFFGAPWTGASPGAWQQGPDVGLRTQVRSIDVLSKRLIVRPDDIRKYGNVPFVLVYQVGRIARLLGWIMSQEAMRVGRWGSPNGRPPAWWVEQSRLRPVYDLNDV